MKKKTIIWIAVAAIAVLGIGYMAMSGDSSAARVNFVKGKVTRGDVSSFITATGNIEPVTEV